MANIGTFTAEKDGFTGQLRTLTLNVKVKLVPNDKGDSENAPDFHLDDTTSVRRGTPDRSRPRAAMIQAEIGRRAVAAGRRRWPCACTRTRGSLRWVVGQFNPGFDPVKAQVYLRLHGLAPQIITAAGPSRARRPRRERRIYGLNL